MEQLLVGPSQAAPRSDHTTRTAALVLVGITSAVLALGAAWLAARFVVIQWTLGNSPGTGTGPSMERDLLAFGTAVPSFAAVAAAGVLLGLAGLGAQERWEGVVTLASLLSFTILGLILTVS